MDEILSLQPDPMVSCLIDSSSHLWNSELIHSRFPLVEASLFLSIPPLCMSSLNYNYIGLGVYVREKLFFSFNISSSLVRLLIHEGSTSKTVKPKPIMEVSKQRAHIVLVHGGCHGAWCWYKIKPLLEAAGHRVTALDLSASGINPKSLNDIRTIADYTIPLFEVLGSILKNEKVILVGHSLGGLNLCLAMEKYPDKISVAVFLTAFLPDTKHVPSYVLDQFLERIPAEEWLDTEFSEIGTPEDPLTSIIFGPKFVSFKLYQLCPPQDVALANMLLRPSSQFLHDLSKMSPFSNEGFGSVKKVYVVCAKDMTISADFQRWEIENCGVDGVKEIENADHMPMLSTPQELCQCLLEIAKEYV